MTAPQQPQPFSPPPRATKPRTWMNIVSLVTSLIGISIAGIILGHLGIRAANRGEADYKSLGIAGLILGYVGIALVVLYGAALLAFVATTPTTTTF